MLDAACSGGSGTLAVLWVYASMVGLVARSGDHGASHTSDVCPRAGIRIFDSGREKFETFLTFVLYRLCSAPDRYALTMPNEARRRGRPSGRL